MSEAEKLIERMRRAREVEAKALGFRFTVRVPNAGEMEDIAESLGGKRLSYRRILHSAVVGWSLKEIDLIPGGSPEPVPFDSRLFAEWLNDNEDAIAPLFKAVTDAFEARRAKREEEAKN